MLSPSETTDDAKVPAVIVVPVPSALVFQSLNWLFAGAVKEFDLTVVELISPVCPVIVPVPPLAL